MVGDDVEKCQMSRIYKTQLDDFQEFIHDNDVLIGSLQLDTDESYSYEYSASETQIQSLTHIDPTETQDLSDVQQMPLEPKTIRNLITPASHNTQNNDRQHADTGVQTMRNKPMKHRIRPLK